MHSFTEVQTVNLDQNLVAKALDFARQVAPTVGIPGRGYRDSNQANLQKVEHDHFVSKLGEEAVRLVFERQKQQVLGPDYLIYQGKQKSWDYDLYVDGVGLAVKSQTAASAQRFGLSWTFQAGTHRKDPMLNNPNAWVCFVEVDESTYRCRVYPPYQIKDLQFGEPKLDRLKASKKVVYAANLCLSAKQEHEARRQVP